MRRRWVRTAATAAVAGALGAAGCAHLTWPKLRASPAVNAVAELASLAHGYENRVYALRQSHFYGELYDDNERLLLSPYAVSSLYHRVDLAGRPMHPGPAHGIVGAGSRVRVEAIEFPSALSYLRRMPSAPAAHVWVRLRVLGGQAGRVHGDEASTRPLVVVLDGPTDTAAHLEAAMDELVGEPAEIDAWLARLRPRVRAAIDHKQVLRGMRLGELVASQGEPWHWSTEFHPTGRSAKVAWYPGHEAVLLEDVVIELRAAPQTR